MPLTRSANNLRLKSLSNRSTRNLPIIVSLFSGAGGLDIGFLKAGYKIALAIDHSKAATQTYRSNLHSKSCICRDLIEIGPQGVVKELLKRIPKGTHIGIIGGPPCQGFSRANTNSAADDPRNELPDLYVKIIKHLQRFFNVEFVVFENVLGILDKKHSAKYNALLNGLNSLRLQVSIHKVCALDHGVAQNRKRVIIAGICKKYPTSRIRIPNRRSITKVIEVIGGVAEPVYFANGLNHKKIPVHPNHWTMKPKSKRFHTNPSNWPRSRSFKLLQWNEPSPTIAFGNREIHIHPNANRRLSIYEAMRLQGFPMEFVFEGNFSEQVEQVSNAVPPPLANSIAISIKRILMKYRHKDAYIKGIAYDY